MCWWRISYPMVMGNMFHVLLYNNVYVCITNGHIFKTGPSGSHCLPNWFIWNENVKQFLSKIWSKKLDVSTLPPFVSKSKVVMLGMFEPKKGSCFWELIPGFYTWHTLVFGNSCLCMRELQGEHKCRYFTHPSRHHNILADGKYNINMSSHSVGHSIVQVSLPGAHRECRIQTWRAWWPTSRPQTPCSSRSASPSWNCALHLTLVNKTTMYICRGGQ